MTTNRRALMALFAGGLLVPGRVRAAAAGDTDRWPDLARLIFPGEVLRDGASVVEIDAPYRAEDAAVVPVTLRTTLDARTPLQVRKITLVIDANPVPVAATFTLGPEAGIDRIATRVRVDDYTNIHAVAELSDGALYAASRFVKAAGGCSAPALKQTAGDIPLGTLRFRGFPANDTGLREAQVMVRHPNYSGMQMDQISRLYIPADFVQSLRIHQADRLLLTIEGGISVSENPSFRFSFRPGEGKTFRVEAADSQGRQFSTTFPAEPAA
nr:quinoprotein dehydrogenase-associated SoxYZ-like carrier [uncultured Rhodopila sp.]